MENISLFKKIFYGDIEIVGNKDYFVQSDIKFCVLDFADIRAVKVKF